MMAIPTFIRGVMNAVAAMNRWTANAGSCLCLASPRYTGQARTTVGVEFHAYSL